jgi:hypothetical protein
VLYARCRRASAAATRTLGAIAADLFSINPERRLTEARSLNGRGRKAALRAVEGWPTHSPGAANAWLLLVTGKPPTWRDPLMSWVEEPPTLGEPHHGFFYPDPHGFWSEVRRWIGVLVRRSAPALSLTEALSVAALVHSGEEPGWIAWALDRCQPVMTLFLDESSREAGGVAPGEELFSIPDPHRAGTVYEGWWAAAPGGRVVGKSPQHPASRNFYRADDMDAFLEAAPIPAFAD